MVVIGASAGGIPAISRLFSDLPANLDAAFFVVLHQPHNSDAKIIASIFKNHTSLKCIVPGNEALIQKGCVYIAPSNYHMMVKQDRIIINSGPRENRYRPSINVLFRSAAVYYGPRVIALILTGMLDDGTSGMIAVKLCGGTAIVQDPDDAEYSQMPVHAINNIDADYILPLSRIGVTLGSLNTGSVPGGFHVPDELKKEVEMTERMRTSINMLEDFADRSDFVCPDCGGGLWKVRNDPSDRYRCHVGHVYSGNQLFKIQSQQIEESLWVSVRMLEEWRNMMEGMLRDAVGAGRKHMEDFYRERIGETEKHISNLKTLLSGYAEDMHTNGEKIA